MNKQKPNLNVVFLGHVGCGKSTIQGHFIYKCGGIDKRSIDKYEKEGSWMGKESVKYVWVTDRLRIERESGFSVKQSYWRVITQKMNLSVINVPGRSKFMKNFIRGASQADVAVLVVSAAGSEFEKGVAKDGQTREHLLIASGLGIKQLIVLVNKMDDKSVNYSETRFMEIKKQTNKILDRLGFCASKIPFIPVSGWRGDNLVGQSTNMRWYKGKTLVYAIDEFKVPKRLTELPLRMPVSDSYKVNGVGIVSIGKVETGIIKPNQQIIIFPTTLTSPVVSVEHFFGLIPKAVAGDFIGICTKGIARYKIKKGMVIGDRENDPPRFVSQFTAQVSVLYHPTSIQVGYVPNVFCNVAHGPCRIEKILIKFNPKNADEDEIKNPDLIKKGESAIMVFKPLRPICVETFERCPALGRIILRDSRFTIGYGTITQTTKIDN
ncbi:elongation factor 1-alpha 1 [Anaeramoeba flamelloides]|uniref:Elongation factor 1-alpha 1 n=1 Tax=Anaeramoeba flamelloides TaxID=1746091 RepID=A0ABQ8XBH7_9EUKA|nr:elongation factor 1-alpha 1 [Anaeramoeba flamelloides]